jgi:hypothetical protein
MAALKAELVSGLKAPDPYGVSWRLRDHVLRGERPEEVRDHLLNRHARREPKLLSGVQRPDDPIRVPPRPARDHCPAGSEGESREYEQAAAATSAPV